MSRAGRPPAPYFAAVAALACLSALEPVHGQPRDPALTGLDPVTALQGEAARGDPSLEATDGEYTYHFASEANRLLFVADPERWAIRNRMCPVMAGVRADPDLFTVHDGRIYAFGSPTGCSSKPTRIRSWPRAIGRGSCTTIPATRSSAAASASSTRPTA